jgi:hypothetical protein
VLFARKRRSLKGLAPHFQFLACYLKFTVIMNKNVKNYVTHKIASFNIFDFGDSKYY